MLKTALAALSVATLASAARPQACSVEVLSATGPGGLLEFLGPTSDPDLSHDGRWAVFSSWVSQGGTYLGEHVIAHDRFNGTHRIVSVSSQGALALEYSRVATISGDGRFVAFSSLADNLVADDTNGKFDVFRHDLSTGSTVRVSIGTSGEEADDHSVPIDMSTDGRFVLIGSSATNLFPNDTNKGLDLIVRDTLLGTTEPVALRHDGQQVKSIDYFGSISGDGRQVAFSSPDKSILPGIANSFGDVYVRDRYSGAIERVSLGSNGVEGDGHSWLPHLSEDGRFVAFRSLATNLVPGGISTVPYGHGHIIVHDRLDGTSQLASIWTTGAQGAGGSHGPARLSPDGRFVVFDWTAPLDPGDTNLHMDVYLHDLVTRSTRRVTLTAAGTQFDAGANWPAISRGGLVVAYNSRASNVVPGLGYQSHVFAHSCSSQSATYCSAAPNSLGCTSAIGFSGNPSFTSSTPFRITASQVHSQKRGLLFYGLSGRNGMPYFGGTLCVEGPKRKTPIQTTGGSPSPDCSGGLSFDFGAWIASGIDPALVIGQPVYAQFIVRDPGSPSSVQLSDALEFIIGNTVP